MKHKIESLPKWAQELLQEKDNNIYLLEAEIINLRKVTRQLDGGNGEWFALFHPRISKRTGMVKLFLLSENQADPICDLGEHDFVMICRNTKNH